MGDDTLTLHRVTFAALRLVAIYLLAQTMFYLPQALQSVVFGGDLDSSSWSFLIGVVLMVASAILLWTQAGRLAQRIAAGSAGDALKGNFQMQGLEILGFALLGTFILVGAIPRLASGVAELIAPTIFDPFIGPDGPSGSYRPAKMLEAAGTLLRIVIGVWLMLGTRSFVGWLRRMRQRGLDGPPSRQFEDEEV